MKLRMGFGLSVALMAGMVTAPLASMAADMAAVGSKAPNFSLPSQEDKLVSLDQYKGKWVVLYFYPKDMTTGCTIEAHNFQRDLPKYDAANAVVLGVSFDTVENHKTFCSKDSLTFKLLADPDAKAINAYGVPTMDRGDMKFAKRVTFLISPSGKIVQEWTVTDIPNHSAEVLAAIEAAKKK